MAARCNRMLALFIVCVLVESVVSGSYHSASVYCSNGKCSYKMDIVDTENATAYGVYNDTLLESGWGILNITAGRGSDTTDNDNIMFAAGYLEAILTQKRIYQNYENVNDFFESQFKGDVKWEKEVQQFFFEQDLWMRGEISAKSSTSAYWRHMGYILHQYDGLRAGYAAIAPTSMQLTTYDFQVMNGIGDMLDLLKAIRPESVPDLKHMTKEELSSYNAQHGHCSALVKVTGAYENVFVSHSSWYIYQLTMRIYKHYDFNVDDPDTAAPRLSFSSYPGFLESLDDFYLLSSQMVMLQTTNSVYNVSLFKYTTPSTLLAWHRVRLANMMARGGKQWAQIFSENNSGTYNNQYMVIDLKQINLNNVILDEALYVVEQIPGLVEYQDVTPILRTGYWPSYNVPYFERIYNLSGYPDMVKTHGSDYTYQLAPRAKIFRRDAGKVTDMPSMKHIMRYNDYKNDPYADGNACNAICCRGDLLTKNPGPFGCYDTKVADYKMASNLMADIINGPTLGTNLPPFQWTSQYNQSHVGLPQIYNFPFLQTQPLPSP